jgi:hypothetical protein
MERIFFACHSFLLPGFYRQGTGENKGNGREINSSQKILSGVDIRDKSFHNIDVEHFLRRPRCK